MPSVVLKTRVNDIKWKVVRSKSGESSKGKFLKSLVLS